MDEKPVQLFASARKSLRSKDDRTTYEDNEYIRNGTVTIFLFTEPLSGWRYADAQEHRTREDWAKQIEWLLAEKLIRLAQSHIETNDRGKEENRMDKIERIDSLLNDCNEFRTTLSSNAVWRMNPGVDAPDFIDSNSAKWRTFKNKILSLDRLIGIHSIIDSIKQKVSSVIRIDDNFIEDLIVDLNALKIELDAELGKYESNVFNSSQEVIEKTHKLFISHASKDAEDIEIIVTLLETLGLHEDEIICSSVPPYCIPLGKKVYDWLVNEFQSSDLHMLFALTVQLA